MANHSILASLPATCSSTLTLFFSFWLASDGSFNPQEEEKETVASCLQRWPPVDHASYSAFVWAVLHIWQGECYLTSKVRRLAASVLISWNLSFRIQPLDCEKNPHEEAMWWTILDICSAQVFRWRQPQLPPESLSIRGLSWPHQPTKLRLTTQQDITKRGCQGQQREAWHFKSGVL